MNLGVYLASAAIILFAGCSAPRKEAARFDYSKKSCAQSVEALPLNNIPRITKENPKAMLNVDFQKAASCIQAGDGQPVPVLLLGLDGKVPSEVNLTVAIVSEVAFASAVDLLDADKRIVRTVGFEQFSKRGGSYTLTLFLNESDANVRFLALRADTSKVGSADESLVGVTNTTPLVVAAGSSLFFSNFVTGSEVVSRAWLSEVGRLKVQLRDYQPAEIPGKR